MSITKQDADLAMRDISQARRGMITQQVYRRMGPMVMIWGAQWMLANCTSALVPGAHRWVWPVTLAIATIASIVIMVLQNRSAAVDVAYREIARTMGTRFGLSCGVTFSYFVATAAIVAPLTARQTNAWISLFFAFAYMLTGVWAGWRIASVGILLAALILFGYFALQAHYLLWMGLVVGGTLFLSGVWLRRI